MPKKRDFGNIQRAMGFKDPYAEHLKRLRNAPTDEARETMTNDFQRAANESMNEKLFVDDRVATHVETTTEKVRRFHTVPANLNATHATPRFRGSKIPPVNLRTGKLNGRRVVVGTSETELVHEHILDNEPGILDRMKSRLKGKGATPSRYVNPKQAEARAKRRRDREEGRAFAGKY